MSDPSPASPPSAAPQGDLAREALALAAFDHVVARAPGFRARAGQREMAAFIAETLAGVKLGDDSVSGEAGRPERGIAVVQAGTGVGKSAAYAATVIPLALAQERRVIISTATVALQEQLIAKDLPALAALMPQPFAYALAKGRGRYVCRLKLDTLAAGDDGSADLFEGEPGTRPAGDLAERTQTYARWAIALDQGDWDGDRDRLAEPPEGALWAPVAAERHTCTARHCPAYNGCSYYQARNRLAHAQVIVVNHDLLLSTLGLHALPKPQDCYLVLDEAHHLPDVAQGQFTAHMDLMHGTWLDRLPKAFDEVAKAIAHPHGVDLNEHARGAKAALAELARLGMAAVGPAVRDLASEAPPLAHRFDNGLLPGEWTEPLATLQAHAGVLLKLAEALAVQLRANARENPGEATRSAEHYARIGRFAPRLQSLHETAGLWLQGGEAGGPPLAKWLQAGVQHGMVTLSAHACPLQPGSLLHHHLWKHVRGAVVTSASLVTCGGFEHFLHEAGLAWDAATVTRMVQSPFDHARQGRLVVVHTEADPKDVDGYTREMLELLMADLREVRRGALVLFTSRAQMRSATGLLERGANADLRARVLVQGEASRTALLKRHAQRVADGEPSILFGLQSFGEGLDLPGELCEWVFITKLPFASPSDPVGQARADWLKAQGRDPFSELVVPATGARLLQWTGRALRTETDEATVVCYDARLLRQSYGRRMLKGLPPYRLQKRQAGVTADV
ncbi:ATP-dependent DNA helicase DinG [Hydrogenophaga crocea]|uniref:ATP-dependent DNA helicase DinG n=1 Tax=Hydrogenophaga crocea TaxID=2716225 RepID=A0A6G8IK01_9BURK|nr:ATP-dependent DNA helicase DinG [Hydrogenophaga crocea]QIM53345.1 ATP-dependent DNA helicase DinG [Hydrogenophaga crocea]